MKTQLELSFGRTHNRVMVRRPTRRARWWFDRMHAVVERAFDWNCPPARPEQIHLPLPARRGLKIRA